MTAFVGNAAAQAAFAAAMRGGSLHHAWLLAGPEGVGKATFAAMVGAQILGGGERTASLIAARSHPDFQRVEREVWDSASPARIVPYDLRKGDEIPARSIRIAQIRMLQPILGKAPALGDSRIIIIDAIDDLETSAANALLKNLEEPPAGTTFLLVSHAPGRLLPTIRSRCRLLRFERLDDADVAAVVAQVQPDADAGEVAALVRAADGAPGRALRYAGLDIGAIDSAIAGIAANGDRDNRQRLQLARALSAKVAQPRYEAFLDRAPSFIAQAARTRSGAALKTALDAHAAARDLAGAAVGLSLDAQATVVEMAGIVASLRAA